ncbi:hypothetical protein EKH57_02155 [Halorubrum sp. BOL3-1]|uniref:hypothetical protein n=1 Tax=Halorubrum sp. BOL3-1 TaxID=2497325 RepID=UPI0010050739|nr:hypothetical protein [Halorubrum sp. BOL3-1]QAU11661.1 hypothetical protein EKH57_02155 [Halorubrum sp. BOL3-1]
MNIALDFLSIFIPAIIGVFGTFYLYKKRRTDQQKSLRQSFLAELREVQLLQQWPIEDRTTPKVRFASNAIYENNAGDLSLLDDDEIEALVRYYTRLQIALKII